ncbi:MAG: hypothetical protein JKX78_03575 [Alteromonadaceae bacterium]|nr:hypothetical protein [Alteromonadaceae bacterium]MBL4909098.1 hypothetical protein [Alteromonadaceae bacterium]
MKKPSTKMKNVIAFVLTVFLLGAFTSLVSLNAEAAPRYGSSFANHLTCALFANKLDKPEDAKIFIALTTSTGKNMVMIEKEVKETVALLKKLSKMQGVPIKSLVEEMYPAMCSYIKA